MRNKKSPCRFILTQQHGDFFCLETPKKKLILFVINFIYQFYQLDQNDYNKHGYNACGGG